MINIQIYKDYYLKSDEHQYILYEKRVYQEGKNVGDTYESIIGYYGDPATACAKVLDLVGRLSKATTIAELRETYKACRDDIINNFKWVETDKEEVKEVVRKRRTNGVKS